MYGPVYYCSYWMMAAEQVQDWKVIQHEVGIGQNSRTVPQTFQRIAELHRIGKISMLRAFSKF